MQFLQRFFGPKNPTEQWVIDPLLRWQVDLDAGLFCGLPIGTPLQLLRQFGPAQYHGDSGKSITLAYPARGFSLFLDAAQRLETVDINLVPEEDMAAFTGRWIYGGQPLILTSATTLAEVRMIFAALTPSTANDTFLAYDLPRMTLLFEWDEGQLENIMLDAKEDDIG